MSEAATPTYSVRPARQGDEAAIGRIQVDAWVGALGDRLGRRRHDAFDRGAVVAQWAQAITSPPTPGHQVYVALCDDAVCGFIAVAPPSDIVAFEVDPAKRRRGHGSRLLAAAVDHLKAQGGTEMKLWSLAKDRVRTEFLESAGFAEAGLSRELEGPGIAIPEKLWFTTLTD